MFYATPKEELPIYDSFMIELIVSDEVDKINEHIEANENKFFACVWRTNHTVEAEGQKFDRKCITIILNPNFTVLDKITSATVVHEIVHVKNMVFQSIHYRPKTNNDEAEAYFVEYLFKWVMKHYNQFAEQGNFAKI